VGVSPPKSPRRGHRRTHSRSRSRSHKRTPSRGGFPFSDKSHLAGSPSFSEGEASSPQVGKKNPTRAPPPLAFPQTILVVRPSLPRSPVMYSFVSSEREKAQEASDKAKMRKLATKFCKEICWRWDDDVAHDFLNLSGVSLPFNSGLTTKKFNQKALQKKYPYTYFLDLVKIGTNFRELERQLRETPDSTNELIKVVLCSYSDLALCSGMVHHLQRHLPYHTLVFVPATHAKRIAQKFATMGDEFIKKLRTATGVPLEKNRDRDKDKEKEKDKGKQPSSIEPSMLTPSFVNLRFRFLLSLICSFKQEFRVPIIVYNPPLPY